MKVINFDVEDHRLLLKFNDLVHTMIIKPSYLNKTLLIHLIPLKAAVGKTLIGKDIKIIKPNSQHTRRQQRKPHNTLQMAGCAHARQHGNAVNALQAGEAQAGDGHEAGPNGTILVPVLLDQDKA